MKQTQAMRWCGVALLLLVLFPAGFYGWKRHSAAVLEQRLYVQIEAAAKVFQEDCRKLFDESLQTIDRRTAPEFRRVRIAIPELAEQFSTLSVCSKMAYKMAKDQLCGTDDFQSSYLEVIEQPLIQPCMRANQHTGDELAALDLKFKERLNRYEADLAALANSEAGPSPAAPSSGPLGSVLEHFSTTVAEQNVKVVTTALGSVIELCLIRQTCHAVTTLLGKPAARLSTSVGTAGICAAADGPLPIGDLIGSAITVGGAAWTLYDIYDISCLMPQKMESELRQGVRKIEQALRTQAHDYAQKELDAVLHAGEIIQNDLRKEVQK